MADFTLPESIEQSLSGQSHLLGPLNAFISAVEQWNSSTPIFFPEYTDHTAQHNRDVIDTALGLLTDDAVALLTANDYVALFTSVLLHDLGMHVTEDGFVTLVSGKNTQCHPMDTQPWPELWRDFLAEAKRFDGARLNQIFGSTDPIRQPPTDPKQFTYNDRLLVGEFLRRHHPRLGHDIAVFGFPGADGAFLKVMEGYPNDLADLYGLIARSHGLSMRQSIDFLKDRFHQRDYQGVHAPALMAALRIADYLQIQPERAPEAVQNVRRFASPFSVGEWKVHQSVKNITPADDDPEAIFIHAEPRDVQTFLKFKGWASGVQAELDATWAVLGEVYGRFAKEGYDKFQLRLRRVRTNIDDLDAFSKTVDYLPQSIAFEAASAELLSLLVAPLYGDKPEVGLRELIQNSVDAVLERWHLEGVDPETLDDEREAEIVVYPEVEDDQVVRVVIEDVGIGMDAGIIKNYFLKAGASFRNSDAWKATFADGEGQSKVRRSGRFGIGALACFLIGDLISVTTRRLGSDTGYQFDAELGMASIEVKRCEADVGSRIVVHVPEARREYVTNLFLSPFYKSGHRKGGSEADRWDWYALDAPRLYRLGLGEEMLWPSFEFEAAESWVPFAISPELKGHWSHEHQLGHDRLPLGKVYCNGLAVASVKRIEDRLERFSSGTEFELSPALSVELPVVVLEDPAGLLPLTLQRDRLVNEMELLEPILADIMAADLVAEALAKAPETGPQHVTRNIESRRMKLSIESQLYHNQPFLGTGGWMWIDGRWLPADWALLPSGSSVLLVGAFDFPAMASAIQSSAEGQALVVADTLAPSSPDELDSYVSTFFDMRTYGQTFWVHYGSRMEAYLELEMDSVHHASGWISEAERYLTGYLIGNRKRRPKLLNQIERHYSSLLADDIAFIYLTNVKSAETVDFDAYPFLKAWRRYIGDTAIPLKYGEREGAFPLAYKELGDRIRFHREWSLEN